MPRQVKNRVLSIYLLKQGCDDPHEIFTKPGDLDVHRISLDGRELGQLYFKRSTSHFPDWLDLFAEVLNPSELGLTNASAAAVLALILTLSLLVMSLIPSRGGVSLVAEEVESGSLFLE